MRTKHAEKCLYWFVRTIIDHESSWNKLLRFQKELPTKVFDQQECWVKYHNVKRRSVWSAEKSIIRGVTYFMELFSKKIRIKQSYLNPWDFMRLYFFFFCQLTCFSFSSYIIHCLFVESDKHSFFFYSFNQWITWHKRVIWEIFSIFWIRNWDILITYLYMRNM